MASTFRRNSRESPHRYRRHTTAVVGYPKGYSLPNSARLNGTPRPASSLERRMVHRSYGDLTMDLDVHGTYPRLQSDFYQELYKKYPNAFRRRMEAREAGRRLFNSHVRFKDEVEFSEESPIPLTTSHDISPTRRHFTNWDREVGHYKQMLPKSRNCLTSREPSECSGSVLSVTQRLKLNSQNLNRLLNEGSPIRRRRERENMEYDSGTENEQSLQDYMMERSKERSRHRKKHQQIIIQRKINKNENGDGNKENEIHTRRYMSKSASPTARHRIKYSVPVMSLPKNSHAVNVDDLIADSDLKIDTVMEKITLQMTSPDSPPDSAIDMDTPSVQSMVTMETQRASYSKKPVSNEPELPPLASDEQRQDDIRSDGVESSPGSSASGCVRKQLNKKKEITTPHESVPERSAIESRTAGDCVSTVPAVANETQATLEINNSSGNTNNLQSCENSDGVNSQGLLQICTDKTGFLKNLKDISDGNEKISDSMQTDEHAAVEKSAKDDGNLDQDENGEISDTECVDTQDDQFSTHAVSEGDNNSVLNEDANNSPTKSMTTGVTSANYSNKDANYSNKAANDSNKEFGENLSYQADDEGDLEDAVAMETAHMTANKLPKKSAMRDSDVDSGIGPSSSNCTEILPPAGRYKRREVIVRAKPIRADHSLLPSRSEVDVEMGNEVMLDNLATKPADTTLDRTDETNIRFGTFRQSGREQRVTEKYRKARSPSPFILINRQPSPANRPKSAPTFAKSEIDLRVVDISLSNDNLTEKQALKMSNGDLKHYNGCNGARPKTRNISNPECTDDIEWMKFASTPNLYGLNFTVPTSSHVYSTQNPMSSNHLSNHRKHSISSVSSKESSLSALSDSEKDTPSQRNSGDFHGGSDYGDQGLHDYGVRSHRSVSESSAQDECFDYEVKTKKGVYKPSLTSPRVNEKRLKLRNIMKNKKGSFSPTHEASVSPRDDKGVVNRIYAKDRGISVNGNGVVSRKTSTGSMQTGSSGGSGTIQGSNASQVSLHGSINTDSASDRLSVPNGSLGASPVVKEADSASGSLGSDVGSVSSERLRKISSESEGRRKSPHMGIHAKCGDSESVEKFLTGQPDSGNTYLTKPPTERQTSMDSNSQTQDHVSRTLPRIPVTDEHLSLPKGQPPKKPARAKHKTLPPDLNFSKYKIKSTDSGGGAEMLNGDVSPNFESDISPPLSAGSSNSQSELRYTSHDHRDRSSSHSQGASLPGEHGGLSRDSSIEVMPVETVDRGNLARAKELSASKSSLLDKTKGKFKKFRKAMSLERGIDTCGVEQNPNGPDGYKGNNQVMPKVKKAPSIKAITSLFKRKKKRAKFQDFEPEQGYRGSTLTINSAGSAPLTGDKKKQWSSCHTLNHSDTPTNSNDPISGQKHLNRPIRKLKSVNPDGTNEIQLIRPEDGPMGFCITKGNPKYGNGIFVSRFSSVKPDARFAGLLSVGDEILEVNGHFVRDLPQDAVYDLISAQPLVSLKIYPLIVRQDV